MFTRQSQDLGVCDVGSRDAHPSNPAKAGGADAYQPDAPMGACTPLSSRGPRFLRAEGSMHFAGSTSAASDSIDPSAGK